METFGDFLKKSFFHFFLDHHPPRLHITDALRKPTQIIDILIWLMAQYMICFHQYMYLGSFGQHSGNICCLNLILNIYHKTPFLVIFLCTKALKATFRQQMLPKCWPNVDFWICLQKIDVFSLLDRMHSYKTRWDTTM